MLGQGIGKFCYRLLRSHPNPTLTTSLFPDGAKVDRNDSPVLAVALVYRPRIDHYPSMGRVQYGRSC